MKKFAYILYLALFCVALNNASAQKTIYQNYTIEDGLPSNTIYKIDEDSKGFIWMATGSGASKFNGESFKNIGNSNGLKNDIFSLFIDSKDRVWFDSHTMYYNYYQNDSIKDTKEIPHLNEESILDTYNALLQIEDTLFLFKRDFFYRLKIDDLSLIGKLYLKEKPSPKYRKLGTKKKFDRLLGIKQSSKLTILFPDKEPIIFSFNTRKKYLFVPAKRENEIWLIEQFKPGAYLCDLSQDTITVKKKFVENEVVNTVFEDSNDNLWFGSQTKGLFFVSANKINSITIDEGLSDEAVYCLASDSAGRVWLGLGNGYIDCIESKNPVKIDNLYLNRNTIKTNHLLVSIQNKLFGVNDDGGLSIIDLNNKNLLFIGDNRSKVDTIEGAINKTIFEDKNGMLWGGSANCFAKIEYKPENNHSLFFPGHKNVCKIKGRTHAIAENKNGFWLGLSNGLKKIEFFENDTIEKTFKEKYDILGVGIRDIETIDDQVWVGTINQGLAVLENDSLIFTINTETHPIGNDAIKNLYYDKKNKNLWVATNKGVTKISNLGELDKLKFTTFDIYDGLISNECTDVIVDQSNTVWISTKNGLSYFNESDFTHKNTAPKITLSNVQIWDKDTILNNKYDLRYDQNDFSVEFEAICFTSPVKFKYKLSGRDLDWQITKNNKVRFSQLDPGDYEFQAYAMNKDMDISEQALKIHFSISPPFWKTWWFILSTLTILSIVAISYYKYQTKQLKIQNELTTLSLSGVRSQMNAHFIFNSLNAIQNYLMEKDVEVSYRYLTKLARLIRQTLYHSNQTTINLVDETTILKNYMDLENLRLKTKFEYKINFDKDLNPGSTLIRPMMMQPYIENSIRWGFKELKGGGKISINFDLIDQKYIKCSIIDNGIGRLAAGEIKSKFFKDHKSMGTDINEERVRLLRKFGMKKYNIKIIDLYDNEKQAKGTKVELILPIESDK